MLAKRCPKLPLRRCRQYSLRITVIILCIYVFSRMKYSSINPLYKKTLTNVPTNKNVSLQISKLNCSGEPLEKWCQNTVNFCDPYFIVYNNLFAVTRSVILQPEFAKGKRVGGENIQDVLNQPEKDEYFIFYKNFIQVNYCSLFIK